MSEIVESMNNDTSLIVIPARAYVSKPTQDELP
jgi:hypothetical protein